MSQAEQKKPSSSGSSEDEKTSRTPDTAKDIPEYLAADGHVSNGGAGLGRFLEDTFDLFSRVEKNHVSKLVNQEVGQVLSVAHGIARVSGLPGAQLDELIAFPGGLVGMVFDLEEDVAGIVLLDDESGLHAGQMASRTGRVLDIGASHDLLGRVIDATGQPLDDLPPVQSDSRMPIEKPAPAIMHRGPVRVPLQTGIKSIDAMVPIGRGQRELILGDRQTGKTAIAIDTIINQRDQDVICIYCSIGQRAAGVAKVIDDLKQYGALDYTIVVNAAGEDPPGLQFIAPYAATAIGEYFMAQGEDVLVIYDDLTHHARAYRELSLLLRRPPGRQAYPGDIFYIHSRLLERSTRLRSEYGGGSLTALPIIETQAQDMSGYIPTNLISITDGQIYLSPTLFQRGIVPPVEIGRSISRVGGNAQVPAYQGLAGDLRLAYSQFEELEIFSRFSTRLDEDTQRTLERGRRVREILKQPQYAPIPVAEQIVILLAVARGRFDQVPLEKMPDAEAALRDAFRKQKAELARRINAGERLSDEDRETMLSLAESVLAEFIPDDDEGEGEATPQAAGAG